MRARETTRGRGIEGERERARSRGCRKERGKWRMAEPWKVKGEGGV
jgi:hypothetical protein